MPEDKIRDSDNLFVGIVIAVVGGISLLYVIVKFLSFIASHLVLVVVSVALVTIIGLTLIAFHAQKNN